MRDEHANGFGGQSIRSEPESSDPVCSEINEETIELHAMGRLPENPVRQHLEECDFCRERVAEHRSWIEDLKQGLREFHQSDQILEARGDADAASRQDES